MIHWVSIWLNDVWRNKFDHETHKKQSTQKTARKETRISVIPTEYEIVSIFLRLRGFFKLLETAWNRRSQNILCASRRCACKRVCSVSGQGEWERGKKCRLSEKNSHKHLRKRKTINILANLISIRINYIRKKGGREKPSNGCLRRLFVSRFQSEQGNGVRIPPISGFNKSILSSKLRLSGPGRWIWYSN